MTNLSGLIPRRLIPCSGRAPRRRLLAVLCVAVLCASIAAGADNPRPRIRDLGIEPGVLRPGPRNAITDVAGVKVGHRTVIRGSDVRTGVTAILPHGGNIFQEKVRAAIFVFNAFGKLVGSTQVEELGVIRRRFC